MLIFMTTHPIEITYFRLLQIALPSQFVVAIPCFGLVLALGWLPLALAAWLFGLFVFVATPLMAGFAWMIAKGSNWTNTPLAALLVCTYGLFKYLALLGLLAGSQFANFWIGVVVAMVVVYVTRRLLLKPFSRLLLGWLAHDLLPAGW